LASELKVAGAGPSGTGAAKSSSASQGSSPVGGSSTQGTAKRAIAHHELPETSAERVRVEIDKADRFLTKNTVRLPSELQKGDKTQEEVEAILCEESVEWAWHVFVTILREWVKIGIPLEDFEAMANEQVENLSTYAEDRVTAEIARIVVES
jgi:hypothetical protein